MTLLSLRAFSLPAETLSTMVSPTTWSWCFLPMMLPLSSTTSLTFSSTGRIQEDTNLGSSSITEGTPGTYCTLQVEQVVTRTTQEEEQFRLSLIVHTLYNMEM